MLLPADYRDFGFGLGASACNGFPKDCNDLYCKCYGCAYHRGTSSAIPINICYLIGCEPYPTFAMGFLHLHSASGPQFNGNSEALCLAASIFGKKNMSPQYQLYVESKVHEFIAEPVYGNIVVHGTTLPVRKRILVVMLRRITLYGIIDVASVVLDHTITCG